MEDDIPFQRFPVFLVPTIGFTHGIWLIGTANSLGFDFFGASAAGWFHNHLDDCHLLSTTQLYRNYVCLNHCKESITK